MILRASLHGIRTLSITAGLFTALAAGSSVGEEITLNCDQAIPDTTRKINSYNSRLEDPQNKPKQVKALQKLHLELYNEREWVRTNCSKLSEWTAVPALQPAPK